MSWKGDKKKDYEEQPEPVIEVLHDRGQIAAIFAHALMTKPGALSMSAIPRQAVEMADQLIAELGKNS